MKYEPGKTGSNNSNYVWALYRDRKDRIWIGMCPGGVDRFDPATGKMTYYMHQENDSNSLSHNNIHSIFEDSRGNIWIGTNGGGLNKIENGSGKIIHYGIKEGLSHSSLGHLYEDANHNLWIGTDAGLDFMDTRTGRITNRGSAYGIPDCFIYGILEDKKHNLWISSNEGLIRFNLLKKHTAIFSVNDGLQSNEFNLNAFCKMKNGEMYFGGSHGFNRFIPEDIKATITTNPPVITDFMIFNKSVELDREDSPLQSHIAYATQLTLPYSASVISFEFAVLNYKMPGNNHYAYYMEGFDKDWNHVKANRTATYTNLDPGTYHLKIRSTNVDSPEPRYVSLKIIITKSMFPSCL
jgi:streptogramin lyase